MSVRITEDKPGHFDILCDKCNERVVDVNKYGYLCKNKCNELENKEAYERGMKMVKELCRMFNLE